MSDFYYLTLNCSVGSNKGKWKAGQLYISPDLMEIDREPVSVWMLGRSWGWDRAAKGDGKFFFLQFQKLWESVTVCTVRHVTQMTLSLTVCTHSELLFCTEDCSSISWHLKSHHLFLGFPAYSSVKYVLYIDKIIGNKKKHFLHFCKREILKKQILCQQILVMYLSFY